MVEVKSIYTIIKSPLLTEKSTSLQPQNKYVFWVDKRSNKVEVKKAINVIYKVTVEKVNIVNVKGKKKRLRMGQEGYRPSWRKAVVTLRAGEKIKLT